MVGMFLLGFGFGRWPAGLLIEVWEFVSAASTTPFPLPFRFLFSRSCFPVSAAEVYEV
jgi:hypothetical protein